MTDNSAWWGPILFLVEFIGLLAVCGAIGTALSRRRRSGHVGVVERWLDRRIAAKARRALDRGDTHILRAVREREATFTVPRQLAATDRRTRR